MTVLAKCLRVFLQAFRFLLGLFFLLYLKMSCKGLQFTSQGESYPMNPFNSSLRNMLHVLVHQWIPLPNLLAFSCSSFTTYILASFLPHKSSPFQASSFLNLLPTLPFVPRHLLSTHSFHDQHSTIFIFSLLGFVNMKVFWEGEKYVLLTF